MITATIWANSSDVCHLISKQIDDRLQHIRGLGDRAVSVEQRVLQEAEITLSVPPLTDREEYEYHYITIVIYSDYLAEGKTVLRKELERLFELDGKEIFFEEEMSDSTLRNMSPREKERRQENLKRCDVFISVRQSSGGVCPKHKARIEKLKRESLN